MVGQKSVQFISAWLRMPRLRCSGWQTISGQRWPLSYPDALAPGNGMAWSVVTKISVSAARPDASSAATTAPTTWS